MKIRYYVKNKQTTEVFCVDCDMTSVEESPGLWHLIAKRLGVHHTKHEFYEVVSRCMFTGVSDREDPICEGDILQHARGFIGVVAYEKQGALWVVRNGKTYMELKETAVTRTAEGIAFDSWTVIGDIYTDPDLLKTYERRKKRP